MSSSDDAVTARSPSLAEKEPRLRAPEGWRAPADRRAPGEMVTLKPGVAGRYPAGPSPSFAQADGPAGAEVPAARPGRM